MPKSLLSCLFSSSSLLLAIAPDSCLLLQRSRRGQRLLARAPLDPQQDLLPQLQSALGEHLQSGPPLLHCVLDDAWARYFLVTPAPNSQRLADCEAAAQMRFHARYGDALQDWQIQANWDALQPFLACALPRSLLAQIAQLGANLQVQSITPYAAHYWGQYRRTLPQTGCVLLFADNQMLLLFLEKGQIKACQSCLLPAGFWEQGQLPELLQRESLRLGQSLPPQIHIGGQYPKAARDVKMAQVELAFIGQPISSGSRAEHLLHGIHGAWA